MSGHCAEPILMCEETTVVNTFRSVAPSPHTPVYERNEPYPRQTVNTSSACRDNISRQTHLPFVCSATRDVVPSITCENQWASWPRAGYNLVNLLPVPAGTKISPRGRGAQQQKTNDPRPKGFVIVEADYRGCDVSWINMILRCLKRMLTGYTLPITLPFSDNNNSKFHFNNASAGWTSSITSVSTILLFCCLLTTISPVYTRPSNPVKPAAQHRVYHDYDGQYGNPPDSTTYLSKFGYLPKSDMETGALRNKSELTKAVKKFQRMAHLPVTGELDTATTNKMKKSRCGVSDDIGSYYEGNLRYKRYVLGPSTWKHSNLTYRIINDCPGLTRRQVRDALDRAFHVWSDVAQLTFSEVYNWEADMEIKFSRMYHHDGYPFDGPGMTLAHAFFPGPDTGGDVHFDADETWTVLSDQGVNLFMVAAHEMGHALGLGHSSVLGSLMYPWYQGYMPSFQLHSDDLVAIQYLYGSRDRPTLPSVSPDNRPTSTTTSPPPRPPAFTTRPPVASTTPNWGPDKSPDPCTTHIDTAAVIRQEVYMFKGLWFWRIDKNGVMDGYPVKVDRFWYNFPTDIDHFDAVYERVYDGKIVFFSGERFWLFSGNHMDRGFPRQGKPLTDFGFPDDIKQIDAAFIWGYNSKTYLITGDMYWRYNEDEKHMDYDYPRDMSMWDGVPIPVSAAFQAWDGITYFIQESSFWRFKDVLMRVEKTEPTPLGSFWLECDPLINDRPNHSPTPIPHTDTIIYLLSLAFILQTFFS